MGVVIRRWVWLETIGVVSGCFPHITYIPTALVSALFCSSIPTFFFILLKLYTACTKKNYQCKIIILKQGPLYVWGTQHHSQALLPSY